MDSSQSRPSRFRLWLPALVLSSAIGLAGCTMSGSASAPEGGRAADGAVPAATTAPSEAGPTAEPQIARTGALSLRCTDLAATAEQLRQLAESMGGFVSSESIWASGSASGGNSRIVFSIPTDAMDRFMTESAKLGELVTRSVSARDVTDQVVDVDARVRTLRDSIQRIQALMAKAGSITEIAKVEEELTRRQSELESLLATQKALKNQVERAPVTVTLLTPHQADPDNPFLTGLARGWEALQNSIAVLLTLLGGILPFALIGAAIGWPVARRIRRRRAAQAASDRATSAETAAPDEAESGEPAGEQAEETHDDGGDQAQQQRT